MSQPTDSYLDPDPIGETWPDVSFSPIERALLTYLLNVTDRPVPREELLREVWGYSPKTKTRTVSTTARRLRTKIEPDVKAPSVLLNVRGQGYVLHPPRSAIGTGAPSLAEVERQVRALLGEDVDLLSLVGGTRRKTNIRAEPNRLVGRDADLQDLATLVYGGARLVTLHGPGGIGKTRLATRFARDRNNAYSGGTWFCDLSDATTHIEMLRTIAEVLGLAPSALRTGDPVERLAAVLEHRGPTLLVLDNFEQLSDDAVTAVANLMDLASNITLIVTSRERLRIELERVQAVHALNPIHASDLLRERIQAVQWDARAPLEADVLDEITVLLEGIPLALEMAAARARVLPLRELRGRLQSSFSVLALDRRGAPDRQRTLTQAIQWSWELLTEDEQDALCQLCLFRGGATLQAIEQVVLTSDSVLQVLSSLLDKSMLRRWTDAQGQRIGLYASVREFGLKIAVTSLGPARARHAQWAMAHLRTCSLNFETDPSTGPALWGERDNIIAAHNWLLEQRSPTALDSVLHMRTLFDSRDETAYVNQLRQTRAALTPSGDDAVRLRLALSAAYRAVGDMQSSQVELDALDIGLEHALFSKYAISKARLHIRQGRHSEGRELALDAIAHAKVNDPTALPQLLNTLAAAPEKRGARTERIALYRQIVDGQDPEAPERWTAMVLASLGSQYARQGDMQQALQCIEQGSVLAEAFNDPSMMRFVQSSRAAFHVLDGDLPAAYHYYILLFTEWKERGGQAFNLADRVNVGFVAFLLGHSTVAAEHLLAAKASADASGVTGVYAMLIASYLAATYADLDDLEAAESYERQALDLVDPTYARYNRVEVSLMLAHVALARARREQDESHVQAARNALADASDDLKQRDVRAVADALRTAIESVTRTL
ncbi:MAG: putative ATPase [Myxococcota bacterium]